MYGNAEGNWLVCIEIQILKIKKIDFNVGYSFLEYFKSLTETF